MTEAAEFDAIAYLNEPRWRSSKLGLERIEELLDRLGRPQDALRFVHVAGTNGKGSICAYLASVLQESGLRTGLFTSPYVERFEERIRVDGENIPADALVDATLRVRDAADSMGDHPTEFELMCAVAMLYFAEAECDIVVLEVGLGGRFDATNVIKQPDACVIARIGLDHTDILGSTLPEIAREKAGIIKSGATVVSWPQEKEAERVVAKAARMAGCSMQTADFAQLEAEKFDIETLRRPFEYKGCQFETGLAGTYQPRNAAVAIEAAYALREKGWNIPDDAVARGIASTQWPGRFEILGREPLFVVDGAHNPQGAEALRETLEDILPGVRPVFLVGVLADKDYPAMLREVVGLGSAFITIAPDSPRALPSAELADEIQEEVFEAGIAASVLASHTVEDALHLAMRAAGNDGVVCAFGSLYSVGAIKRAYRA